ncbi:hypothetical protein VUR80DRAFT_4643 [Thermomyces stellatus]
MGANPQSLKGRDKKKANGGEKRRGGGAIEHVSFGGGEHRGAFSFPASSTEGVFSFFFSSSCIFIFLLIFFLIFSILFLLLLLLFYFILSLGHTILKAQGRRDILSRRQRSRLPSNKDWTSRGGYNSSPILGASTGDSQYINPPRAFNGKILRVKVGKTCG